MKKQLKIIMPAMAMLLVLAIGCSKEDDNIPIVEEPIEEPTEKEIAINVGLPNVTEHRVAYEDTSHKLTWEEGDQLLIMGFDNVGHFKGKSTFTYTGTPGKTSGSFTGTTIGGAVKYKMYYPATIAVDKESGAVTYPLMNEQEQKANGSTAHLKKYIVLENTDISDLSLS
jgi:hypothetical protein